MKKQQKTLALWMVVILVMAFVMKVLENQKSPAEKIEWSKVLELAKDGKILSVTFKGQYKLLGQYKKAFNQGSYFEAVVKHTDGKEKQLQQYGVIPNFREEEKQSTMAQLLINWFPMILLFVIFYFFLRQLQSGGGKAMSFGKSKAKMLNDTGNKVTFDDVSGIEEAKEELVEIVDFLKDPKKYTILGGKIPKGVLLVGPPGTGKTLLARAVAGEAAVPFFSISGSDFVEMFVGVGASRVRDLFEQGKKAAPCIIFIDEIDAVGRHRGSGMGGGHDEREQTLNQMLVEMDGFESNEGVIIMAATNRADVLDPALLRPGRFDRRVTVSRPDVRGRLGILKVHTSKTPLADDINLEVIAKGTPGFTGADLANLVNEAALLAARMSKKFLENIDFENAKDKVLMGVARRSMVISDKEKRNTAFHEAGHAVVGMNLPETDPVHKVSIIPRGMALGVTVSLPTEERLSISKTRANNEIAMLLGGRIAEQIVFGDFTNGASNDIERATSIARSMVCDWGMSEEMGTIHYNKAQTSPFGYGQGADNSGYSEETAKKIDAEVKKIIDENYEVAQNILTTGREVLDNLSESLIVWETLDSKQVKDLIDGKDIGVPVFTVEVEPEVEEPSEDSSENSTENSKQQESADVEDKKDGDDEAEGTSSPA
jgi:cell division protease FtsH